MRHTMPPGRWQLSVFACTGVLLVLCMGNHTHDSQQQFDEKDDGRMSAPLDDVQKFSST
jgi:hypothetical protein